MVSITDWIIAFSAIAAIVVAIFALLVAKDTARKQILIQIEQIKIAERQTEIADQQLQILNYQEQERRIENSKAMLRPEFIERQNGISNNIFKYALRIKNVGKATARDIYILIDDKPAHEYFAFLGRLKEEDIPHTLEPNEPWEYDMAFAYGREPKFKIKIDWSDDSGTPRSFDQRLLPVKGIPSKKTEI